MEIRNSRPVDLPVPSGDEEELLDQAIQGEQSVPVNGPATQESSKGKGGSTEGPPAGRGERFSTPASWEEKKGNPSEQVGLRTEGEMPEDFGTGSPPDDRLQRALEQEIVEKLHRENLQLSQKGFTLGDREPALLDLRFADDILLFAKSYAETVSLLHDLVTAFLAYRLDSITFPCTKLQSTCILGFVPALVY